MINTTRLRNKQEILGALKKYGSLKPGGNFSSKRYGKLKV